MGHWWVFQLHVLKGILIAHFQQQRWEKERDLVCLCDIEKRAIAFWISTV